MISKNEDNEKREVFVKCMCGGCGILDVIQDKDNSVVYMTFHTTPSSPSWTLSEWFRSVWFAITGKTYFFYDLVLDKQDVIDLKEAIACLEVPEN